MWNTLPSYFAHTHTVDTSLVSGQLYEVAMEQACLRLCSSFFLFRTRILLIILLKWNDFPGWQYVCKVPENEHNLCCEKKCYVFWGWEINEISHYTYSLHQKEK
jgi:hypothetical protein